MGWESESADSRCGRCLKCSKFSQKQELCFSLEICRLEKGKPPKLSTEIVGNSGGFLYYILLILIKDFETRTDKGFDGYLGV